MARRYVEWRGPPPTPVSEKRILRPSGEMSARSGATGRRRGHGRGVVVEVVARITEGARLALEAGHAFGVRGERLRQGFQSDIATRGQIVRPAHFSHAACAELRHNLVRTKRPSDQHGPGYFSPFTRNRSECVTP